MDVRLDPVEIAVDRDQVSGTVLSPAAALPGVLFAHGWGGSQEHDLGRARQAAGIGCVCLTFDLRGHVGTEALHASITPRDNLDDALAAYDTLAAHPAVDSRAICVVGSSYGAYLAAILTTSSFIPQAVKTLRSRNTAGISLAMYVIFTAGVTLWLVYGIYLVSWPMILANTVTLLLSLSILLLKLRHG